jgi:site-specific DNA recombinase
LERPALQALLADIRARKVDVVVVYKVDRLTRSLADFAKLVEVFEAHGVSFVAVTQQFNTTTSMGRLTLNVLLSFAQFERELAGERIRDKFAASRRKGMWMGGTVPLGYDVSDRKLVINAEEAARVRVIFERYLALGCVSKLQQDLEQRGIRSKQRVLASGQVLGGGSFGRGALYHLLQNRIYLGEVVHKGVSYSGEHEPIIDEELWSAVQARLLANRGVRRRSRLETGSLLTGLLVDGRGNLMSPTYSARRGKRYRYYVSRGLVHGVRKEDAGSHCRVGAEDLERLVVKVLAQQLSEPELLCEAASGSWSTATRTLVRGKIQRVVVHRSDVEIIGKAAGPTENGNGDAAPPIYRAPLPTPQLRARKEIIIPGEPTARRVNHGLIFAIARAKRWMQGLCDGR